MEPAEWSRDKRCKKDPCLEGRSLDVGVGRLAALSLRPRRLRVGVTGLVNSLRIQAVSALFRVHAHV